MRKFFILLLTMKASFALATVCPIPSSQLSASFFTIKNEKDIHVAQAIVNDPYQQAVWYFTMKHPYMDITQADVQKVLNYNDQNDFVSYHPQGTIQCFYTMIPYGTGGQFIAGNGHWPIPLNMKMSTILTS